MKGVSGRASGPRKRRRILRERDEAFQEEMREIRDPLGAEEAATLRETERQAQAQGDPSPQEDAAQAFGGASGDALVTSRSSAPPGPGDDFHALEFDVVLQLAAALARTPPGVATILSTRPAFDENEVRSLLAETSEAWAFRIRHGRLPLSGVEEVSPWLSALKESGGAGLPGEFRPILTVARAAEAVRKALEAGQTPHLAARREALPRFEGLLERARRLFDADGGLRDDASAKLSSIRARLRRRRVEVSGSLEKILESRRDTFSGALVVLRNDRYCLPVSASARSRVPGIVHDRSGSGQTVFVEPIEVIEANNDLALLAAEERREVEKILAEFGRLALACASDLEEAVRQLAKFDALEAKVEFGELSEARIPEISEDDSWTLAAARHPLLDTRLAALRRRVLKETREERDAVPLDLEISAATRLLVVSGPNAGGKTVVLKTAGLLSLLAQAGFPVSAGPGTRLPVFSSIRTEIGDAQAILSDRSTFSSSMDTLASILERADSRALALIDEIGAATDPEEGSALSIAFLEAYLARGGRAIVTTHLSALKAFAAERPDALSAAMESERVTGRPTYRLVPGLAGRSRALSVAAEHGIPEGVLERARFLLGEAWTRREKLETEAEEAIERLRRSETALAAERREARSLREEAAAERETLARERGRILREGLEGFDRARHELSRRVEAELERLRREPSRQAQATAARIVSEAEASGPTEEAVGEAREEALARSRGLSLGDYARIRGLQTAGTLASFDGDFAWLKVGGKRLRVARSELEPVERAATASFQGSGPKSAPHPGPLPGGEGATGATREVNVIGHRLDEAIPEVEKALDGALLSGASRLRVVHGHGTGRLRNGLREHLRQHPAVARLRSAAAQEGGDGATIVELA